MRAGGWNQPKPGAEDPTAQLIPFLQQIHGIKIGGGDTEVDFLETKPKMQGVAVTWILIQIKQLYIFKKTSVETLEEIWTEAGRGI